MVGGWWGRQGCCRWGPATLATRGRARRISLLGTAQVTAALEVVGLGPVNPKVEATYGPQVTVLPGAESIS